MSADAAAPELADGAVPVCTWLVMPYDTRRFPFAWVLKRDAFGVRRLDLLHEYARHGKRALNRGETLTGSDNLALRKRMQDLPDDSAFYKLYRYFMRVVLAPAAGGPIAYSNHPKMRVHLSGTPSVSSFHSDVPVTRRIDQVNFWMPFTDVAGSAALCLESWYGRGDYAAVPVRYGEVLIFDGGYLCHGTVANATPVTRVSLDMRFSLKGATTRAEGVQLMNTLAARVRGRRHGATPG